MKAILTNLPYSMTEEEVFRLLSVHFPTEIVEILLLKTAAGTSKGCCVVKFHGTTFDSVQIAVDKINWGRNVQVQQSTHDTIPPRNQSFVHDRRTRGAPRVFYGEMSLQEEFQPERIPREDSEGSYSLSKRSMLFSFAWDASDRTAAQTNYEQRYPNGHDQQKDTFICYGPLCKGNRSHCRDDMAIDHIIPVATLFNRAKDSDVNSQDKRRVLYKKPGNLTLLCSKCNSAKGSGGDEYDQDKVNRILRDKG